MTTTNKKNPSSSKPSPDPKKVNDFVKYSGLAFELLAILFIGVASGYALDIYLETSVPFITIITSLLSLTGMIFYLLRRLPKD